MKSSSLILFFLYFSFYQIASAHGTMDELTEHLKYLAERDKVLSKNIANADTPKFLPKDLDTSAKRADSSIKLATTHPMHIPVDGNDEKYQTTAGEILELKPNGNGVTLEHEMMKKSENATEMQETANLYSKAKNMLKASIVGLK